MRIKERGMQGKLRTELLHILCILLIKHLDKHPKMNQDNKVLFWMFLVVVKFSIGGINL